MYSSENNLAFVHIPKTGGTSIEVFFTGHDWLVHGLENKHATQDELSANLKEKWKKSFRFTIVRNPWARILSIYDHGIRDRLPNTTCKANNFTDWLSQKEPVDHMDHLIFRQWISNWDDFHLIARFERLQEDFSKLLSALKLQPAQLPNINLGSNGYHDFTQYNDVSKRIIAERCGEEIERFKFRFEDAFNH